MNKETTFLKQKIKDAKFKSVHDFKIGYLISPLIIMLYIVIFKTPNDTENVGLLLNNWEIAFGLLLVLFNILLACCFYFYKSEILIEKANDEEEAYQLYKSNNPLRLKSNCILHIANKLDIFEERAINIEFMYSIYNDDAKHSFRLDLELFFPEVETETELLEAFQEEYFQQKNIKYKEKEKEENKQLEIELREFKENIKLIPNSLKTKEKIKAGIIVTTMYLGKIILGVFVLSLLNLYPFFAHLFESETWLQIYNTELISQNIKYFTFGTVLFVAFLGFYNLLVNIYKDFINTYYQGLDKILDKF